MRKRWGGLRARAGRKRVEPGRRRVEHQRREEFAGATPLHVTVRLVKGLPTLRSKRTAKALKKAFIAGNDRFGFRLVHFSVISNHLHFIVEAEDRTSLSRGMQGLMVRIARHLNSALVRSGKVFADRFHANVLRTTLQVRNALLYVLNNARRHGIAFSGALDPYSSGAWFTGWRDDYAQPQRECPIAPARTAQLRFGFLLHGRLDPFRVPGPQLPLA